MSVYRGSVIHDFVVDRLAVGFSKEMLQEDFHNFFALDLTGDEFDHFSLEWAVDVVDRERVLRAEAEACAPSFTARIEKVCREVELAMQSLKSSGDVKSMVACVPSWIRAMELNAKLLGQLDDSAKTTNTVNYIQLAGVTAVEFDRMLDRKRKRELEVLEAVLV